MIFDIGANVGEWSKYVLSIKNDTKLHCFEPSKYIFSQLLNKNFPSNVICNNFGLGSKEKTGTLHLFAENPSMSSIYKRKGIDFTKAGQQTKTENITLDTIDNYCLKNKIERVDFVKIDVEGHELEVLKGARQMMKEGRIKLIQFEYGGCYIDARIFLKDIFEYFQDMNYEFYKIYPKKIKKINKYQQKLDNFHYTNYLVVRRGYELVK